VLQHQQITDAKVENGCRSEDDRDDQGELSRESEMQYLIHTGNIKPWSAKALIQSRLDREARIATNTPLRTMNAVDGLHQVASEIGGVRNVDETTLFNILSRLLDQNDRKKWTTSFGSRNGYENDGQMRDEVPVDIIRSVLQCMDFKKSETLSVGEWARGLITFFEGTQEEKEHALFSLLDQDGDHYLSIEELREYLKPFVKAMTPEEASELQPWLLQRCADQILGSIKATTCRVVAPSNVDKYGSDMVSYEELFQWLGQNSLVDSIAQIIDTEVSRIVSGM